MTRLLLLLIAAAVAVADQTPSDAVKFNIIDRTLTDYPESVFAVVDHEGHRWDEYDVLFPGMVHLATAKVFFRAEDDRRLKAMGVSDVYYWSGGKITHAIQVDATRNPVPGAILRVHYNGRSHGSGWSHHVNYRMESEYLPTLSDLFDDL